jgi:peptidoglycan/LPS O-acetylase OafA/YrhL
LNTPSTRHIPYLDGWRGLAIVSVLVGHFGVHGATGWLGPFGVALFFALSGYLIGELLFVKKVGMPDFFARRFSRVVPTFWLFVTCMALFSLAAPAIAPSFDELLSTLVFARTYFPADLSIWANRWPIGHLWSLNVEEHSYAFLALVALLLRRQRPGMAVAALVGSVVMLIATVFWYRAHPPGGASPWHLRTEVAALGIVSAAALHVMLKQGLLKLPRWAAVLSFPAFALALVCFAIYEHKGVHLWVAPLCLAFAVNQLDKLPALLHALLSLAPLRWFGRASFSLYLWQQPFFMEIKQAPDIPPLLLGAAAVLAGTVSFYAFEDPVRVWLNRAWAQRHVRREPGPAVFDGDDELQPRLEERG